MTAPEQMRAATIMPETPEEWQLEQRAFHAAGRDDVPKDVQELISLLWKQFVFREAWLSTRPATDELVEALSKSDGISSGPNGSGGMRVLVNFPNPRDELALFDVLTAALRNTGDAL